MLGHLRKRICYEKHIFLIEIKIIYWYNKIRIEGRYKMNKNNNIEKLVGYILVSYIFFVLGISGFIFLFRYMNLLKSNVIIIFIIMTFCFIQICLGLISLKKLIHQVKLRIQWKKIHKDSTNSKETNDLIKQDGPTDTQYFVKDFKEIKVYRDEYGNKRVQTRTMVNIVGIILFTVCNYYMIKEIFSKEPVYIINQTGDTVIDFIQMIFPAVVTPIFVAVEIWLIIDLWKYLKERKVRDTMQKKKLGMKQIIYRIYVAIFCILFGTMSIGAFVNSDILPIVGIMIKYLFTPLVILAILFFIFTVIDDIRKL